MGATHPESDLLPYLSGELSPDERQRVEQHLAGCALCRESISSSTAIMRALARDAENLREPNWTVYRAQLKRKIAEKEEPRHKWWRPEIAWPFATAGFAAAALVLAFTLLHVFRSPAVPPTVDQFAMEDAIGSPEVGLLRNYQLVEKLDLLENYDVIERLDTLSPADNTNGPSRS